MDTKTLQNTIGYHFKNEELLKKALTHTSYANDMYKDLSMSNERLEFLGDAILDAAIGLKLYQLLPNKREGELSKLRSEIVCEKALHKVGLEIGLNNALLLGKGEDERGGRNKPSIVSDAMEALFAAAYFDGGIEEAVKLIYRVLDKTVQEAINGKLPGDYKTDLQIYCQKNGNQRIEYKIIDESGPDHDKLFTVAVYINGKENGVGTGKNKKEAESKAAFDALNKMEK